MTKRRQVWIATVSGAVAAVLILWGLWTVSGWLAR